MNKHPLETAIENHGITIKSEFVPFSKSRNASRADNNGKPWKSLNWKVTLQRGGRDILTTDYGAGVAHCPGYQAKTVPTHFQAHSYRNASGKPYPGTTSMFRTATVHERLSQYREAIAAAECESGFEMELDPFGRGSENVFKIKRVACRGAEHIQGARQPEAILPKTADVVHSLIMDASVLDSGGFEDWASELGYDTDSRNAESIYRACLEIALKLRAGLGENALSELREAAQDY
jgi:hypothetical protein